MKVAIYGQYYKTEDKTYIEELFNTLNQHSIEFVIEQNYYSGVKKHIKIPSVKTFNSYKEIDNSFDFMFTVGGDGTILRAVTYIRDSNIPIVGINTGRLGFLATVQKEEIATAIELLLQKKYKVKERTLLSVTTSPKIESLASLNFAFK